MVSSGETATGRYLAMNRTEAKMKKVLKCSFLGLALAVAATAAGHAQNGGGGTSGPGGGPIAPHQAPEVDPALAIGGLSLVGGTLAILRAKRRK
jgi:hypothetical protein